jgi:threonine/homoserine/homoserine lactone efflux protein
MLHNLRLGYQIGISFYMFQILSVLCSGLATGLLLSVPIGPANLLCLEKTLKSGSVAGFMTGAGATFGDFLFVLASVTGIVVLGDVHFEQSDFMKYVGIIILLIFSVLSFLKAHSGFNHKDAKTSLLAVYAQDDKPVKKKSQNMSILSGFLSSFILTVTNPLTPVGVMSSVAAVGLGGGIFSHHLTLSILFFVSGILVGSLGWWLCLTIIAKKFANRLTKRSLSFVNYGACFLMIFMAVYLFITL